MRKSASFLLGFVLLLACGSAGPPRPNVIVVVVDTLRPDATGLYGYPRETAPYLSRLGAESAVFLGAWSSSSWTAPSTASLFTGLYPRRHGVELGFHAHKRTVEQIEQRGEAAVSINRLASGSTTLPEHFGALGYRSFGLASNVNIGSEIGFDRGFDRFEKHNHASAEELETLLDDWADEIAASAPSLVYLHLNDVHAPYEPREPWYQPQEDEREDRRAAYDSEISYVDTVLERVLERLDPMGDSLLVVLSDHGEEFWEHGHGKHTHSLHYELGHILMLVRAPSLGVEPARLPENVSIVDVLPTLLDLLEAPVPADVDGQSLAPLLRGGLPGALQRRALAERPLFAQRKSHIYDYELTAVVKGKWHLIENGRRARLYDLENDTLEAHDVARQNTEVVEALRKDLAGFTTSVPHAGESSDVSIDAEQLEHLRALGYAE